MYIISARTGEKRSCSIKIADNNDLPLIKKNFSSFDWKSELSKGEVSKLIIPRNSFIHGLISIRNDDGFLNLRLIESAKVNIGKDKLYDRVAANLIAFAASIALERFEGFMNTISKSGLIPHYCKVYGFVQVGGSQSLISYPSNSKKLVALFYE